jgi:hypothetical protein
MDGHELFTGGGVDRRWRRRTPLAGICDAVVRDWEKKVKVE